MSPALATVLSLAVVIPVGVILHAVLEVRELRRGDLRLWPFGVLWSLALLAQFVLQLAWSR